jgi:hypothetical protein
MKPSPKKAIATYCKGCIYDHHCSGNWREQVEACTITNCDLYDHRPLTAKTTALQRENLLAALPDHERAIVLERAEKRALNMVNLRSRGML